MCADANHRRHAQGPPHRRPARARDAADLRPRARERLQPRAGMGRGRRRARPLRRLGRDGDRGALARRRARRLRRVARRRVPRDRPQPRQAPPHRRAGRRAATSRASSPPTRARTTSSSAIRRTTSTPRSSRRSRATLPRLLAEDGLLVLETAAKTEPRAPARATNVSPLRRRAHYALHTADGHRDLSRHVRPRHERAHRRDQARGGDLRPRRDRRRQRAAPQEADVHARRTRRVPQGGARRASTTWRSTSSPCSSSTSRTSGARR